jgi:hypothetical protein
MSDVLLHKQILWYKSKLQAFPGKMTVTKTRFTFMKAPRWAMMFGALSALFINSAKGKAMVDDEIRNLKFTKGRSLGKKAYMLQVTTSDGNTYDFLFDDSLLETVSSVISFDEALVE